MLRWFCIKFIILLFCILHKSHRGAPVVVVLEAEVVSLQQVELLAHLLEQQPPARLGLKILRVS